jgi:N-formylglutamate amidohydrolase
MTDWYTDELFSLPEAAAAAVRFPVSRLIVDPERFLDDRLEVMASRGMGVIYTRTSDGTLLREPPSPDERNALIDRYYKPHHASLFKAAQTSLASCGYCLVVDCHSFPSHPLPCDIDQNPDRPNICLGTDEFHTPPWLRDLAQGLFAGAGFSVAIDRPFRGALVPSEHYQRATAVHAIMVEINRHLYMDEDTGVKLRAFNDVAAIIRETLLKLIHGVQLRLQVRQAPAIDGATQESLLVPGPRVASLESRPGPNSESCRQDRLG